MGVEFSFWNDKKVPEFDRGGQLHNTVNVLNATELYVKRINFMLCEFYPPFKKNGMKY